tara:strand:- start:117 stop:668 length:552 start_codon:yes stop_codon:yes gene_type:complete
MPKFNGNKFKGNGKRKNKNKIGEFDCQDDNMFYAKVDKLPGTNKLNVILHDGREETVIIPGKYYKKVWFKIGDYVVVSDGIVEWKVTTVKQINEASRYFSLLNNDENIFSNNNGIEDEDEDEDEDENEINNNLDNENNPESDDIMSGYVYNDEVEFVIEKRKDKFGNDIEDDDIRDFMGIDSK